jgi:CRISPR system Cascade subunit CasD
MQSWGIRARWDVRDTRLEPTKSGVIGLIGCAMGLRRNDPSLERLDQSLRFGVRIDKPGVISTDYHTVTGYHRTAAGEYKYRGGRVKTLGKALQHSESTVVSHREYLHDASFLAALTVWPDRRRDDPQLLERIFNCLRRPKWPPYLGRKSCVPARPFVDEESLTQEHASLEEALQHQTWEGSGRKDVFPATLEIWIECTDGGVERQDALRVNRLRNYDFRRCKRIEAKTDELRGRAS